MEQLPGTGRNIQPPGTGQRAQHMATGFFVAFLGEEGMRLLRSSLLILLEQSNQEGEKAH